MDAFGSFDPHWGWLAIGMALAVAEMAIPGVFLIWLSGAAIITGLLTWLLPIGVPWQIVIFAALSIASVFIGRRYLRSNPVEGADPLMNDRGARLIGESAVVTEAIKPGSTGRVKQGDSEWLAKGPAAELGARMRITGHDGVVLIVEHMP
jgi:inner membrane protein